MATQGQGLTDFGGLSPMEDPAGDTFPTSGSSVRDDYQDTPSERSSRRKKRSKQTIWSRLLAQVYECGQVLLPLLQPPRLWWTASAAIVVVSAGAWYIAAPPVGDSEELAEDDPFTHEANEFGNPEDWPALKSDTKPAPTDGPLFGVLPSTAGSGFPGGNEFSADSEQDPNEGMRQAIHYVPDTAPPGDSHVEPAGYQHRGMPTPAWLAGTIEDDAELSAEPRAYDNFRPGPR